MDFLLKKESCKDFLNNYHKEIYPILLPKLIEIGILTLKLSFDKVLFSPDELNDIITSLNEQYNYQKRLKQIKNQKKLKKLTNNSQNKFSNNISFNERNTLTEENYTNTMNSSNFYDSSYFIPQTKSYRNRQLYNKRLENPMFSTLNKDVYPFWWWNQNEPDYFKYKLTKSLNNQKILFKDNYNSIDNKKNYFTLKNKTNYKISYDKNLNVIKVETGKKGKTKNNK